MEQYGSSIKRVATTVTVAGTTTLVNTSPTVQVFTGTTTQTVVLPDMTTFTKPGASFEFYNNSTGAITIEYHSATLLASVPASTTFIVTVLDNTTGDGIVSTLTNSTTSSGSSPSGSMLAFGGTSAPAGWLLCDGTSYLRASQSALFAVIGTAYGAADGTHFNVPDLRGRFIRGVDGGSGNDPDASSRTATNPGGNVGNNVGSLQSDAFQTHTHGVPFNISAGASNVGGGQPPNDTGQTGAPSSGSFSSETRPKNVYVNYIIKT